VGIGRQSPAQASSTAAKLDLYIRSIAWRTGGRFTFAETKAFAGIVVNNNIVLIDTYNELKKRGLAPFDAVLRTSAQRLRPVLLTTITTVLGLMPMVLKVNVDLFARDITFGGPSTDWWAQLASAVAGGLAFATLLTLVLTPALLLIGAQTSTWLTARRARSAASSEIDSRASVLQPAE
jgi:multidrug efflux pump